MASVNKAIVVGILERDPEVRKENGQAVANFFVETTDRYTDQAGKQQAHAERHNIVVRGKQAEPCGRYLSKGSQVYVEGWIQTCSDDDRGDYKRRVTEIVAHRVQFLGVGGGESRPDKFPPRKYIPLECLTKIPSGIFTKYRFSGTLAQNLRAETGRILSCWGDTGWGRLVAQDKDLGHFRDELVEEVVKMLRESWQPAPSPTWVTCVPSLNHPKLVSDFARKLAKGLRLPFRSVVSKIKNNPQKRQRNRYEQWRNLDGVFRINGSVLAGSVLLVDDIVDSRCTMTVVAALLRQAGSGPVWPVALATASPGGSDASDAVE